jgi:hypothetical protein
MGPGFTSLLRASVRGARRRLVALTCACVAAALSTPALAAAPVATAYAQASIIDTMSIVRVDDMVFGSIVQPSAAGTVVMTADGSPTCTVTGGLIRNGICKAAHFSVNGKKNKRIFIRENNGGVITLTDAAGDTMTVTNLTMGALQMSGRQGAGGWDFGSWNIDAPSGIADFWVAGTLNVAISQSPGTYTGVLNVQIQLN